MDTKITNISNLVYNLLVIVALGGAGYYGMAVTIGTALLGLVFTLSSERIVLGYIQSAMEDLNENRLSKFEAALAITKVMEVGHAHASATSCTSTCPCEHTWHAHGR